LVKITWKKYQIITVAFTAFFILASGGLSFWIYQSYQKALEDETSYLTQISTAKVKRDKVPELEKQVIMLRENVKEFVKILPDTKEVNGFVKKLSDFDDQSGVELYVLKDDTRASRRKKKDVFDRETFRVELRGNIFQFLKFISLVENYERFIKISEIQIKAGSYDEEILRSDVVHQVSLLVETFVYHGNEGVAGATKIQNYEKKRELLHDEIISEKNAIKIERYEYAFDPTIRDPFIDPHLRHDGKDLRDQGPARGGQADGGHPADPPPGDP
jgi:Tfp pilus assembly protein PilO